MNILLLGDYSNVHATLAEGLRALGHCVVVCSDGDGWKNYPRDVDLCRYGKPGRGGLRQRFLDALYMFRLRWLFARKFRGYDVVQLINPVFLPLRAERIMPFYGKLRRNNGKVFMAAYGMDHYWVKAGMDCKTFRYSDFNFGCKVRNELPENALFVRDWLNGPKGELNRKIANDCDGIPAGLYEYWQSYRSYLDTAQQSKLRYIPFPIVVHRDADDSTLCDRVGQSTGPVRFFIGIQQSRSAYKGTDIMLRALQRLESEYPQDIVVHRVENVPFDEYRCLMRSSDVILDQLYSYTPAMNALEAMNQGLVVVGGAEPEYYTLQEQTLQPGEEPLRPIVNVEPDEESVYQALRSIVAQRAELPRLKVESRRFVERYHDHVAVAQAYVDFWNSCARIN